MVTWRKIRFRLQLVDDHQTNRTVNPSDRVRCTCPAAGSFLESTGGLDYGGRNHCVARRPTSNSQQFQVIVRIYQRDVANVCNPTGVRQHQCGELLAMSRAKLTTVVIDITTKGSPLETSGIVDQ